MSARERIVVSPDAGGLGVMFAELIKQNLAEHPDRVKMFESMHGRVNVTATDAGVGIGMLFTDGELSVGSVFDKPDLSIATDSGTLLELSSVPLRFGRPDVMTAQGRAVIAKIANGKLKVRGLVARGGLLSRFQRLLSVAP